MSSAFQTAVKSNVHHTDRREAINRLIDGDEQTNLSLIVQMGGMRGEFRRQALEGLADCGAHDELAELADDTTVDPSLRRRAADLA